MNHQLMIIFIFISYIHSQNPINGCLKMNDSGKCEFCDFQNGYKLTGDGLCNTHTSPNCQIQSLTGNCISCQQGYYIDSLTFKCVQINQGQVIENCITYDENQQCVLCKQDFYLSNNLCNNIDNVISNCLYYESKIKCLECQQEYILSIDQKSCQNVENKDNCSGYGRVTCEICDIGYTKNYSYYQFYFLEDIKSSVYNEMIRQTQNKLLVQRAPTCQKIIIEHCKDLKNFVECWECEEGYILNEKDLKCEPYPNNVIFNCAKYKNINQCQQCNNGYHLSSIFECIQNEEVIACDTFDGTQQTTVCTKCQAEFFLLNEKNCSKRTRQGIEKCINYPLDEDRCSECEDGFSVTSDGLKCLKSVPNCIQYQISSENTKDLECFVCEPDYYLSVNEQTLQVCVASQNQKCDLLENFNDKCKICENKFYLNPNDKKCQNHINIQDCNLYSQDKRNECKQCSNISIDYQIYNYCIETDNIENCLYYNSQGCTQCQEGYELNDINNKITCIAILNPPNCLIKDCGEDQICIDTSKCLKCQEGYVKVTIDQNILCKQAPIYITESCLENNIQQGQTSYDQAYCNKCKENHVPLLTRKQFVCLDQYYVELLINSNSQNFQEFLNCQKIAKKSTGDGYYCMKCIKGYIEDNGCKPENSCTGSKIIFKQFPTDVTYITGEKVFTCENTTTYVANCSLLAPFFYVNTYTADFQDPNVYLKCIQCKTDYQMVINLNQLPSYFNDFGSSLPKEFITNYNPEKIDYDFFYTNSPVYQRYPITECTQLPNKVNNCEHYIKVTISSTDHYYCAKCKHQYTGNLTYNSVIDNYVIQSCVSISQCTSKKHIGLPGFLNFFLSCHECQENKIPYLNLQSADPTKWVSPKLAQLYKSGDETNVECFDNSNKELPDNCLVGIKWNNANDASQSDSNKTTNINRTNIAIFCASCQPGYRRKDGEDEGQVKIILYTGKCEEIDQCESSEWANYCSQCVLNYSYKILNEQISYDSCIYSGQKYCYAYNEALQKCEVCKRGYSFNYDNECELIKPPKCDENNSKVQYTFQQPSIHFHMYALQQGCNQCQKNFYAFQNIKEDYITCSESEYITQGVFPQATNYIQNCIVYSQDQGYLVCEKCTNGFVLSYIKHLCIKNTFLDGCMIALSDKKCYKCQSTHVIVNHICEQKKIANCLNYLDDTFAYEQVCITCAAGFYLSGNSCNEGKVEFCDQYEGEQYKCKKCKQGFQKIENKSGHYCLKIDTRSNCTEDYDQDLFKEKILQCKQCNKGQPLVLFRQNFTTWQAITQQDGFQLSEDLKTFCFQLNKIDNCLEYDNSQSFQDSTFGCLKCDIGYYTDGVQCQKQINVDENCLQMASDKDQCDICNDGYFLDTNNKCTTNPVGIPGCRVYKSSSQCSQCVTGMFVQNNQCIELNQSEKLDNCLYYDGPANCSVCVKGFIVQNFRCIQGLAKNCLTYSDINNCETCSENYMKIFSEGRIDCVYKSDQNCSKIDTEALRCIECINGYFINELGTCQDIQVNIKNCDIYESKNTCKYCQKGYILSIDKQSCDNDFVITQHLDPNCLHAYQIQNFNCQVCSPGYYMKNDDSLENGTCTKCEAKNCFYCDPFKPFNCMLCNIGYIMNIKGECQQMIQEQNNNQPTEVEKQTQNLNIFLLFFFWLLIQINQYQIQQQSKYIFYILLKIFQIKIILKIIYFLNISTSNRYTLNHVIPITIKVPIVPTINSF